jgi:carbon monoxide dehydrogenase subunit G
LEFDNKFEVPVPLDEAWALLMDIERIAPCVPGAEMTEVVDESTFKGRIAVKLGPVSLTFNGQCKFEEKDDAAHTARIKAQGTDGRGRGGAQADVDFSMKESETGATVLIHTNLQLSGAIAQYGRGVGMVADLAQHIIGQFAECLQTNLLGPATQAGDEAQDGEEAVPADKEAPVQAAPVQMGGLGFKVLWNALVRGLRRLFGGRE